MGLPASASPRVAREHLLVPPVELESSNARLEHNSCWVLALPQFLLAPTAEPATDSIMARAAASGLGKAAAQIALAWPAAPRRRPWGGPHAAPSRRAPATAAAGALAACTVAAPHLRKRLMQRTGAAPICASPASKLPVTSPPAPTICAVLPAASSSGRMNGKGASTNGKADANGGSTNGKADANGASTNGKADGAGASGETFEPPSLWEARGLPEYMQVR